MTTVLSSLSTNTPSSQTVTSDTVINQMDQARAGYALAKDGAAKAAAHAYMVWLNTLSGQAPSVIKSWFEGEIEAENAKIVAHNSEEATLKDRVRRLENGNLKKDDPLNKDTKDKAEIKQQEADRAALQALFTLNDKAWAKRRQIGIELGNDPMSSFAAVVRFTFQLKGTNEASVVSRYASVLAWVEQHFVSTVPAAADEVVDAIKAVGGFEAALQDYRGNTTSAMTDEDAEDRKIQRDAIAAEVTDAVISAPAKGVVALGDMLPVNGLVTLIGRVVNGQVEVVGQLPSSEAEINAALLQIRDGSLLPTHAASDFVARTLALGQIVQEGAKTAKTTDGLVAGKLLKETRAVSLVPHATAGLQVVISGLYGSASVIVKATPNANRVKLGTVNSPVMLPHAQHAPLAALVEKHIDRNLVDITPIADQAGFVWQSTDRALAAKNRDNAVNVFGFEDMASMDTKPLDVDGFKPQFTVSVTAADLKALFDSSLKVWAEDKASNKSTKLMRLGFVAGKITYTIEGGSSFAFPFKGLVIGTHSLQFRPRDLVDLVTALLATDAPAFDLKGDTGGMLGVTFSDANGTYDVFLPTATADRTLNPKRVEPMRCEVTIPQAA